MLLATRKHTALTKPTEANRAPGTKIPNVFIRCNYDSYNNVIISVCSDTKSTEVETRDLAGPKCYSALIYESFSFFFCERLTLL